MLPEVISKFYIPRLYKNIFSKNREKFILFLSLLMKTRKNLRYLVKILNLVMLKFFQSQVFKIKLTLKFLRVVTRIE